MSTLARTLSAGKYPRSSDQCARGARRRGNRESPAPGPTAIVSATNEAYQHHEQRRAARGAARCRTGGERRAASHQFWSGRARGRARGGESVSQSAHARPTDAPIEKTGSRDDTNVTETNMQYSNKIAKRMQNYHIFLCGASEQRGAPPGRPAARRGGVPPHRARHGSRVSASGRDVRAPRRGGARPRRVAVGWVVAGPDAARSHGGALVRRGR